MDKVFATFHMNVFCHAVYPLPNKLWGPPVGITGLLGFIILFCISICDILWWFMNGYYDSSIPDGFCWE
ncbi:hypothetical protein EB796_012317 [Bugula neritina]|uniref:Uncharacterized protein n=1 Tax=Bugula neritina TaxID=10212 RepID=A0A7J7JSQ2_BUGNE|nr:hypothetical protein EB796_012317 [Bugula neritina]